MHDSLSAVCICSLIEINSSVVAVATEIAEVDTTAQHKDRDEQRGQELPLGLTESGHLLQDVVDNCHKPFPGSSGSEMGYPH